MSDHAPIRVILALVALAALAGGCGGDDDCEPSVCPAVACQDPFSLTVVDATTAAPIDDASATGDVPCSTATSGVECDAPGAGTFAVTVSAPGYVSAQVSVKVEPGVAGTRCACPVCPSWEPRSVALSPQ